MADIMPWNHNKNSSKISKSADSIFDKQKHNEFKRINLGEHQYKTILIIDDEPDILYTLKLALENSSEKYRVHTYNNPLLLLSEFKSNYYDLLLVDINMPFMNGFELSKKILELDLNIRICFMSTGEINLSALRDVYPGRSMGCFIKKPIKIKNLIRLVETELD